MIFVLFPDLNPWIIVGKHTWISPNVILDGSGGLEIGDYCSISAGVQIYTHHTVEWATSMGKKDPKTAKTNINNGVYLGPNSVIQMETTIGNKAVIGVMSFVNSDIQDRLPPGEPLLNLSINKQSNDISILYG